MALVATPGLGADLDTRARPAVVCRDLLARGRYFLCRFNWWRHVEQTGGTGIARRATRALSAPVLGNVLARRAAGGDGRTRRLAGAARARRAIPAGMAGTVLDRVRARADQAAALRAPVISGDCHSHGGCARASRAVAFLAYKRGGVVVSHSSRCVACGRRGRCGADAPAGVYGLALRGRGPDLRTFRVVALRRQPRGAFFAECGHRGHLPGSRHLWPDRTGAYAVVSERRDCACAPQRRLRRTESGGRRLS